MKKPLIILALLCLNPLPASFGAETIRFGETGQVKITPPNGWQIESKENAFGLGNHTVTLIANKSRKPGCTIMIVTGERQPAHTEASFLAYAKETYAEGAFQFVEKTPVLNKLNVDKGIGYYYVSNYTAMAGKPPAEGMAKVYGCVLIYRENSPLIRGDLFVDDPNDPALDMMVNAVCGMEVLMPRLPPDQVLFDNNNFIKIDIPKNWGAMRERGSGLPEMDRTYNLKLKPPPGQKASLTLTVGKYASGKPPTQEQLDALAVRLAKPILPETVEKKAAFKQLQMRGGRGLYCVLTDASLVNKTPAPDDYKHLGLFLASFDNGCIAYATALTDDPESTDFELMLKSFSSIEPSLASIVKTPPVQITKNKQGTLLSSSISKAKLLIPSQNLRTMKERSGGGQDNPGYFYFEDTKTNILMSGWLEPASKFQYSSTKEMWDSDVAKMASAARPKAGSEEYQEIGVWDVFLYDGPVPPTFKDVCNSHMRANYNDGVIWIDLHLSLTQRHSSKAVRETLIAYLKTMVITGTESGK